MRIKLAGFVGRRSFAVFKIVNNRPEFVPVKMMPTLQKADSEAASLSASGGAYAPYVMLDDGDWMAVTPEFRNFYREER